MTSFMLHHLIYVSRAQKVMKPSDNLSLLASSKEYNSSHEISGVLVYKAQTFVQLLEGPQREIQTLYRKIRKDSRHTNIQTLINEPTYNRYFPESGMEFHGLDHTPEKELPPYTRAMNEGFDITDFTQHPEHALRLLVSFRELKA